jgi:flagellar hook protein FlgE
MVSQQIAGASAPGENLGGTNSRQVGLGMQLASIDTVHTQGSLQNTNRELDLGISGDGYFRLGEGENTFYSRAGNFYLDQNGDIVNSDGLHLLDMNGNTINIPADSQSFSIGQTGTVNVIDAEGALNEVATISLAYFTNPEGLQKAGSNLYQVSVNSGAAVATTPGQDGTGTLVAGTLEMANVDLSDEFTEMIVAQRGFQANTRIITTSDEILQELVNLKR